MKILAGLLLGILLFGFVSASAQMSRGTIENELANEEKKDCEFVSMQDGIDTPMRFALTFPSTPNVVPDIHGTDPLTEFSSDFNNDGFFFSTNSTDIFTIRLDIDYDIPSEIPRLFFYELFTGENALNTVGNWQLTTNHFCKILEFNAKPAPHILSDEEIVATIAGYEKEQHEITHLKQDETNNMIAVIVIAVVTVSVIGLIVLIMMKLSRSRDSANSILVSRQFAKQSEKVSEVIKYFIISTKYQDLKIEEFTKRVEQSLRDIMIAIFHHKQDEKKFAFPKPPTAYVKSSDENVSAGMKIFDAIISNVSEMVGIQPKSDNKEESLYDRLNKKTIEELYDEYGDMYKKINDYYTNELFKERYDLIIKIIKERTE